MKPRTSLRLRVAVLWPLVAAVGIVAPLIWFVATAPLEVGTATLLLDTVEILLPQAARATASEPRETHRAIRELAASSTIRITLIAEDGKVLAESTLGWERTLAMDDHGSRPEVLAALAGGSGTSVRWSDTLRRYFAYAAKTFRGADGRLYILRLARPLEQVHLLRRNLTALLLLAVVSGLAILAPISWWLHRGLFRPLRQILEDAGQLERGDFRARVAVPSSAELGTLAASLNRLAAEVETQLDLLASERNELREILGSMSEAVMVTDAEGRVRRANDPAEQLFEPAGSIVGRLAAELGSDLGELVARALAGDRAESMELELGGAERRAHSVLASPLPGGQGAVVAARDLAETLRLGEIRRDLVANVSHELKTPLTAIRGYAETLEDGALAKP
ncbi:MAG: HAMP domain-containing protein, partial [Holophagales bacterium]|nr:HAMP domain-containing protein [Holophagales bacterium]